MDQPLVSVLMTAYNREEYIGEAIESVISSDYINFELIIVDDGSTDNTALVAKRYAMSDRRIRVWVNAINKGQFENRNIAASFAVGEYLKYLDSDDLIYPNSIRMMVDAMRKFPDAGLAFCLTHGPSKNPLPYRLDSKAALQQHFFEGGLLFCGPSGLIIKSIAFKQVGGFEEFGMPSDNHLTLKIASLYPVVAVSRDLFWWRQHPLQVYSLNNDNHLNIFNNYAFTKDIVRKHLCLSIAEKEKILRNQNRIFFLNILRLAARRFAFRKAIALIILYTKSA